MAPQRPIPHLSSEPALAAASSLTLDLRELSPGWAQGLEGGRPSTQIHQGAVWSSGETIPKQAMCKGALISHVGT